MEGRQRHRVRLVSADVGSEDMDLGLHVSALGRGVLTYQHLNHPPAPSQEAARQGSRATYAASWRPELTALFPVPWGTGGGVLSGHLLTVERRASS